MIAELIGRLRAQLAAQLAAPFVVSAAPRQYVFGDDAAAYAELDVKRGEALALVVVIGGLPSEAFVVEVWHRHVPEVWLIDPSDQVVHVARAGAAPTVHPRGAFVRSAALPGVVVSVDALFAAAVDN